MSGEAAQRVFEAETGDARRGGREAPGDEQREACRDQEGVAEEPETAPGPAVEPEEEEPRDREVAEEVERIQRVDEARGGEGGVLERSLPREVSDALPAGDPAGVVEGERPVGAKLEPHRLIRSDRARHEGELRETVVA